MLAAPSWALMKIITNAQAETSAMKLSNTKKLLSLTLLKLLKWLMSLSTSLEPLLAPQSPSLALPLHSMPLDIAAKRTTTLSSNESG